MRFPLMSPRSWSGRQWLSIILALSIIPVLFFGTILYGTGTRIVEDEVDRASQHSINQMKDQIDILTHQIEQFTNQFSLQSNVTQMLNIGEQPSLGSLQLTNTLVNDLSLFTFLLKAVDSAYLYHVAQNTVIHPQGVTTLGIHSLPDTTWLEEVRLRAPEGQKAYWIAPRRVSGNSGTSSTTISYVRVLPNLTAEMKAVLIINIKMSYLRELLNNFPLGADGGVLIFNENNSLITSSGAYQDLEEAELDNITATWTDSSGPITSRLQHPNAFVTYSESGKSGWTYALLVPADAPVKSVQSLRRIIIATTVALSVLALFTSYFSFQRFSNGVKRILQALSRSNEGEFDVVDRNADLFDPVKIKQIEQRVVRLMEENRGYKQKYQEQDSVMRNNYLHSLLLGQIVTGDTADVQPPQLPETFVHPRYSLFIIEMDESKPGHAFGSSDRPLFQFAVANIALELLSEITPTETVLVPKHTIAVLNLPDSFTERKLLQTAELLRETILKILKHSVTISVSQIALTLKEMPELYSDASLILQRQWLGDGNEVIFQDGTLREKTPTGRYPVVWEDRLFRQIRAGDNEGAKEALTHFHEELYTQNLPFSQLKTLCLQLLVSAIRIFGNDPEMMDGRRLYDEFMRHGNVEGMTEWLEELLTEALPQSIQKLSKRHKNDIESKVLSIIEERYSHDLSLQLLADECGVSTSYLSELFKNSMGITFIQYVTNLRVEKTKHLLLHTDLTIAQIAEAVGYSNAPQLIRVFKKASGTTPGEFRNTHS